MTPDLEPELGAGGLWDGATPETISRLARMPLQRLTQPEHLSAIRFEDGLATVSLDASLLPLIRFKNAWRTDAARLAQLRRSIAAQGYLPTAPVICRIGRRGKWVVVDGGHRLTAMKALVQSSPRRRLAAWLRARPGAGGLGERLARLIAGPRDMIYAILFLGPRSDPARMRPAPAQAT